MPRSRSRLAGERAARLTSHLLAFARRQPLQPESLDLGEVVGSLHPLLHRVLGESIELRCELPAAPLLALADRAQVESALVNLALNSRDAMPNGGVFTVAIDAVEADVATSAGPDVVAWQPSSDCAYPTPASACRPTYWQRRSSRFSPPRRSAKAPVSD